MSSIEWTDETWNPVTGCTKISEGCTHCYAEGVAKRFWGDRAFGDVQFHPSRLWQPFSWRKPRRVFVNSMSDLFHPDISDEQIDSIFAVMAQTPEHTYQVLTKRPKRMLSYCNNKFKSEEIMIAAKTERLPIYPYRNVWLGVSCENQRTANERIPLLLQTRSAVRFLSCEPLLEEVDILSPIQRYWETWIDFDGASMFDGKDDPFAGLHWCIAGGESGPKARPCDVAWIKSIVGQCEQAELACFVKQLGSNAKNLPVHCGNNGKSKGKMNYPEDWPHYLQVRQYPATLSWSRQQTE